VRLSVLLLNTLLIAAVPTGPDPGQPVPDFRLPDQNGLFHNLQSVMGAKGAMLVFYRSADW
jgi:peroxiredoxin